MSEWVIRTSGLWKQYGSVVALEDLALNVRRGEIYAFLGPNGAGKTTTIRILLGMVPSTSGTAFVFDRPVCVGDVEVKRRIGVVPENHPRTLWPWVTGAEYLSLFCDLHNLGASGRERIPSLLERVGLAEAANRRVAEYSRGMLQRLSICRAILPDPELLVLDEPISGIDPLGVKEIRDLIAEENRQGRTIFISSHILSEVEKVCDRVGILNHGRLVREEQIETLSSHLLGGMHLTLQVDRKIPALAAALRGISGVRAVRPSQDATYEIDIDPDMDRRSEISAAVVAEGAMPIAMTEQRASLEDAFVAITQPAVDKLMDTDHEPEGTATERDRPEAGR